VYQLFRCACGALIGQLLISTAASASSFEECSRAIRVESRPAAECFLKVAEGGGRWREAGRWLEDAQARHPASGWITFYLAEVESRGRSVDALPRFRSAIDKFVRRSDAGGEAEARIGFGVGLLAVRRFEEAWTEALLALEAARRSGDALLVARALLFEASLVQQTGERLARGLRVLREAEALVFPSGPWMLQRRVLGGLGKVSYDLGRYEQALSHYSTLIDLAQRTRDQQTLAIASYSALTTRRKQMEELPEPEQLPEFTADARRLLVVAEASGQPAIQAMAHRTLADLLAPDPATREVRARHYRVALAYARKTTDRTETATCLWALGRFLGDTDPVESRRLIDEALRLAVDSGNAVSEAYAWRQQMRLAWKTFSREGAAAESLRALEAIETLRTLQSPDLARATVLGAWTLDYHWLIGQLLVAATPTRSDVALAFEVAERMRARLLLDSLLGQPSTEALEPDATRSAKRQQLLRSISEVQRRLLDPRVAGASRQAVIAELERLEREEESVRADLFSGEPSSTTRPEFTSLERVEQALHKNEAMLSFSVGVGQNFYGEFAGGAWLLVSTNAGTRVIRVPDRVKLHPMLSIFRGLAEQAQEADVRSGVRLHEVLLQAALSELPATVNRLIIVPDGPLHHLPFAALRPTDASAPLGSTHEIAVVPSATVWLRLKQQSPISGPHPALVFADPALPDVMRSGAAADERGWSPGMVPLGGLPYARTEGQAVVSHLRGGSRLLAGVDATEAAVKAGGLGSYAIVHFATHALVDEGHPDRSAVVLAGDAHGEDGLLQAREIADLPFGGHVVVLSACRSATGAVLAGEGVVGLSRSFFEAGARTVVGTLWAIRDDHAAEFFDAFYASVGRGRSVGAAMLDARRHAMNRGMPASAWASVVVIGDDTVVAARGQAYARSFGPASVMLIGAILLALVVLLAISRRNARRAFDWLGASNEPR
jgi:CHAT domain-containing protein/tetratricopeptide (TPR) repeat protein